MHDWGSFSGAKACNEAISPGPLAAMLPGCCICSSQKLDLCSQGVSASPGLASAWC